MKKIKDLNADELADYAFHVFLYSGRHAMGAGLIYRCIDLDKNNPLGLRCLSDFLDWRGSESMSALILEHILQNKLYPTPENEKDIKRLLFTCKWVWGFSKHKSGKTQLSGNEFDNPDAFEIDEKGYHEFKTRTLEAVGTWENLFKSAHHLIGIYAGVVHSPTLTETDTFIDTIQKTDFSVTDNYNRFLEQDTSPLERIRNELKKDQ